MRECDAFRAQAASDFAVYLLLLAQDREDVPECHPLHYLQMATEKLAKAVLLASNPGFNPRSHVAFSRLPKILRREARAAKVLGYGEKIAQFRAALMALQSLVEDVERLSPQVADKKGKKPAANNPNVEYPWEGRGPRGQVDWIVPATHQFGLLSRLRTPPCGVQLVEVIQRLLERFDEIFA